MKNNKMHSVLVIVLLLLILTMLTGCTNQLNTLSNLEDLTALTYKGAFNLCKTIHSEVVNVEYTEGIHEIVVTFANKSELTSRMYDDNKKLYLDNTLEFSSNEMTREDIAEFIEVVVGSTDLDYTEILDSYENDDEITKSYDLDNSILDIKLTHEDSNFYKLKIALCADFCNVLTLSW